MNISYTHHHVGRVFWATIFLLGFETTTARKSQGAVINVSTATHAQDDEDHYSSNFDPKQLDTTGFAPFTAVRLTAGIPSSADLATGDAFAIASNYTDEPSPFPAPLLVGWNLRAVATAQSSWDTYPVKGGSAIGGAGVSITDNFHAFQPGFPTQDVIQNWRVQFLLHGRLKRQDDGLFGSGSYAFVQANVSLADPEITPTDDTHDELSIEIGPPFNNAHDYDIPFFPELRPRNPEFKSKLFGPQGVNLLLGMGVYASSGGTGSASADYSSTMKIFSFDFYDEQGNFVPGITVVDSLGVSYPVNVVSVPEPNSLTFAVLVFAFEAAVASLRPRRWSRVLT